MFLRYLRSVAVAVAAAMAVSAGAVCLFPPLTLQRYASTLTVAGFVLILFGVFSVFGGWTCRGDWKYVISQSASDQRLPGRVARTVRDAAASYYFLLVMLPAGGICLLIGTVLERRAVGG